MRSSYEEIYETICALDIIDTHEHLPYREQDRPRDTDILREYLTHYFSCDLVSAGLPPEKLEYCRDISVPLMRRWELLEPFWNAARHTGYGRSLDIAVSELYGMDRICSDTLEALNADFLQSLQPGHFEKVLKKTAKIKISLVDGCKGLSNCDARFFRPVFRLDMHRGYAKRGAFRRLSEESGIEIRCFDDWLEVTEREMDRAIADGCVALKIGDAYNRPLLYPKVEMSDARDEFLRMFNSKDGELDDFGATFQNFMLHYVLGLAGKRRLTVQIHTGLQEGNGNMLAHSDPLLLNNLFLAYPDVCFDIFHMGYPFEHKLSALAKNFANVHIDMCWAHIISPAACVNAMAEWFDSVPANKISAFGGDYCFIDGVAGHSRMARQNVGKALARKVDEGCFDVDEAKRLAVMLFVGNPSRIFKLKDLA